MKKMTLEEINKIEYFNGYSNISIFSTGGGCCEIFASLSDDLWFMGDCLEGGLYVDCNPNLALDNGQCFCVEWQEDHEVYMPTDRESLEIVYTLLNLIKETGVNDDNGIMADCHFWMNDITVLLNRVSEKLADYEKDDCVMDTRNSVDLGRWLFENDGIKFISRTGRRYDLLEGTSIMTDSQVKFGNGTRSFSDMFFVVFDDSDEPVNDYVLGGMYGASSLETWQGRQAYLNTINDMVNEYESKNFDIPVFKRFDIDLGGPTDCLIEYFVEKLNRDMYRNRDNHDIPCMASINAEVLGEIVKRTNTDDCHFYLCVGVSDEFNDDRCFEWQIVETFNELVAKKDEFVEIFEVIVEDDPELYQLQF